MQSFYVKQRADFEAEVLRHIRSKDFVALRRTYKDYRLFLDMFPEVEDYRREHVGFGKTQQRGFPYDG